PRGGRAAQLPGHAGAVEVAGQDCRHRTSLPDAEGGCQASLAQRDGGAASCGDDAGPALRARRPRVLAALRRSVLVERAECVSDPRAGPATAGGGPASTSVSVAAFGAAGARP